MNQLQITDIIITKMLAKNPVLEKLQLGYVFWRFNNSPLKLINTNIKLLGEQLYSDFFLKTF